jgi:microcystin-dependent protein
MRRIQTLTAVLNKFGAGKHGFTDGDPAAGIASTDLEAALFDHVQEELCAIVEAIGGSPDGSARNQVLTSIQSLIAASAMPSGSVIYVAKNSTPNGYLKANGALVSRATYAALFAAIGTTFGVGDGATTFALPDLRGEFPRGWDDGRGVDSGRVFGSAQVATTIADRPIAGGQNEIQVNVGNSDGTTTGSSAAWQTSATATAAQVSSVKSVRPRNIALLACIKY